MKHDLKNLDTGQLELMWQFLQLQHKCSCTKSDVRMLKEHLDIIRQAMIQKTAGQRKEGGINFEDLGTYINFIVLDALNLYIYGGLDKLEYILPEADKLDT